MTSRTQTAAPFWDDTWVQVLGLVALSSGAFTAHFLLAAQPAAARQAAQAARAAAPAVDTGARALPRPRSSSAPVKAASPEALKPRLAGHWLVDSRGGLEADCTTVQAALAAASDGDRITVKPGVYHGYVSITKSVTIQGSGSSPDKVELTHTGPQTVTVAGGRAVLGNLTVANTGGPGTWVVLASKARLSLERVKMRAFGNGIRVIDSEFAASDSDLSGLRALYLEGATRASILRTALSGRESALTASGGGVRARLSGGFVRDSAGVGIDVSQFARVTIEETAVTGNLGGGASVRSGAELRAVGARFVGNRDCALRIDGGFATLDGVHVERNRCGIGLVGRATVDVNNSVFSDLSLGALAIKPGMEDAVIVRGAGNTGIKLPASGKRARR